MTTSVEPPQAPGRRRRRAGRTASPPARIADGLELIGEYEGSGFKEAPYIARRADGQVIQLTYLLYLVARAADGERSYKELAATVTESFGRRVSAANIQVLVEKKLRPLGVLAAADGSSPEIDKPDPLLALKFRAALVPERAVQALTTVFRPLFYPPVMVAALLALLALDVWLFGIHGVGQGIRESVYQPLLLVVFFGLVVVATAFHEIGHASACRYGGAKPGVLGAGIYVVWPVFYCDVTDAYRLGKGGRLRTDLGGVYFNGLFALLMGAVYFATGFEPILLVVVLQHFAVLQQLMPLLRLDGYYIMSDLTGVPDILSRVRPILRSLVPGKGKEDKVEELKPWVRVVVSAYVLTLIPVLAAALTFMLVSAPRIFSTAYDSFGVHYDKVSSALGDGKTLDVSAGILQMVAIGLPCLGLVFTTGRIGSRVGKGAWTWSGDSAARRSGLVAASAAVIGFAAFTWWPNGEYRPIQPAEKATLASGLQALSDIPSGRPSLTPERQAELGGAPSVRESGGDFRDVPETPRERRPADEAREAKPEQEGRRDDGSGGSGPSEPREPESTTPQEPPPAEEPPPTETTPPAETAPGEPTPDQTTTQPAPAEPTTPQETTP